MRFRCMDEKKMKEAAAYFGSMGGKEAARRNPGLSQARGKKTGEMLKQTRGSDYFKRIRQMQKKKAAK